MTTSSSSRNIRKGKDLAVKHFSLPDISLAPVFHEKKEEHQKKSPVNETAGSGQDFYDELLEESELEENISYSDSTKQEVDRILEEARREAEEIREQAEKEAAEKREQAEKDGYVAGFQAGEQEGREKARREFEAEIAENLEQFQKDMEDALESVGRAKEKCLGEYLDELKDCSIAVAEKVIRISLRSSGEVIKRMITATTEKLKQTTWVKIYIDRFDYTMMMKADADVASELSRLSTNIKFVVMDKEQPGTCIIEMPDEIIDASVNTQIETIKEMLENVKM